VLDNHDDFRAGHAKAQRIPKRARTCGISNAGSFINILRRRQLNSSKFPSARSMQADLGHRCVASLAKKKRVRPRHFYARGWGNGPGRVLRQGKPSVWVPDRLLKDPAPLDRLQPISYLTEFHRRMPRRGGGRLHGRPHRLAGARVKT